MTLPLRWSITRKKRRTRRITSAKNFSDQIRVITSGLSESTKKSRKPHFVKACEISLVPASHEDPKNPGVLKKVLVERGIIQKGEIQMVNFAVLGSGKRFARHYHEDMDEAFILTSGNAVMKVDEEIFNMTAHDVVVVPARCEHEMANETDHDVTYIVFGVSRGEGGKTVTVGS